MTTRLTPQDKRRIRELLERDVPISRIKDELDLPDADLVYEALDSPVNNRVFKADKKYHRSRRGVSKSDRIVSALSELRTALGPIRILDHGCGSGDVAAAVARALPDCEVHGVELTETQVRLAHERYSAISNLTIQQGDGYDVSEPGSYDVVYHTHVLEHVPDKTAWLAAGLRFAKPNGVIVFSFPTERYWRFWGFVKFIGCRIFGRPFQIHAFSDSKVDAFVDQAGGTIREKYFYDLCLPRRVYYYIPERVLEHTGRTLNWVEGVATNAGIKAPMMFVFYVVAAQSANRPDLQARGARSGLKLKTLAQLVPASLTLGTAWVFSSACLVLEVLAGRKEFFRQE